MNGAALLFVTNGISAYNRANGYLQETLKNTLAQTYLNVKIVVAGDCSPDATQSVERATPVRNFCHETGLTPNNSFNSLTV